MKARLFILLSLSMTLLFAANAHATFPDELTMGADCEGWSIDGHFYFGPTAVSVNVEYTVELSQGGSPVLTITDTDVVYPADPYFAYGGMWGMELCGDYEVNIHLYFQANDGWGNRYFDTAFTCECNGGGGCTFTPGYWKNHPDAWPVDMLTVGGITYTKAELLEIFDWPTVGDITVILFHHLVAAKLNVLSGADDGIQGAIDDGDAYLVMFPLGSAPEGEDKEEAEDIKDELADYNEIPCEEEEEEETESLFGASRAMVGTATVQEKSWGGIKQIYKK